MGDVSVFHHSDYKAYLRARIGEYRQRKGGRAQLAKALDCQPTFVSQVLNGELHFSLEHIEKINRTLGHSEDEGEYLFLLVLKQRAGTKELRSYFESKLQRLLSHRRILTNRLGKDSVLSKEQQATYYSSWHYAAIHIAVAVPVLQTREKLAEYFGLPMRKVTDTLDYLCSTGLVHRDGDRYTIGATRVRLGSDSPNILKHHTNWRIRAVESLDRETPTDLHYSAVLCLSEKDKGKIKDRILDALKEHLSISDASSEEELCCYNIDFFSLKR